MAVSSSVLTGDLSQVLKVASDTLSASLRVAIPGIVQSFDADSVTCDIQIGIKGESGGESTNLSVLTSVPVVFPRGGGITMTFPIKSGDECLLVFGDRCIDFWHQSGDIQETVDERQHDLSDAFAIIGPQSQAKKISGISTSAAQFRSDDGGAYVEINPTDHTVTVQTSGRLIADAQGGTEITSPTIVLNGAVTINGSLSQGMGESGGNANMLGPITVTNDVTVGGISVKSHKHGGVQTGGGETGGPV
ncbi:Gp138 family membrane-puncturing spike protein [Yersinia proxima]|uniref:Gp138 family membrane-puncturing spike protein n=1 Tax=Yersinia proxima TaxID=2890316 RepID=UPI003D68FAC4